MSGGEVLNYVAALAVVLGTVITSIRAGSRQESDALVTSLRERIEALEGHIADLEKTIAELRADLQEARKRWKV